MDENESIKSIDQLMTSLDHSVTPAIAKDFRDRINNNEKKIVNYLLNLENVTGVIDEQNTNSNLVDFVNNASKVVISTNQPTSNQKMQVNDL